jgi:drug/metabolite transporter (DMT)-like permease
MNKYTNANVVGHLNILGACIIWGLMAPLGKDAMNQGISGIDLVTFRVVGSMLCFWVFGWLTRQDEHVCWRDRLLFAGAGLFGIVTNQCCFTIGLSLTAPTNASIMTTTMPIVTLLLTTIVLHERLTWQKMLGVVLGICGALILILHSKSASESRSGNLLGDILVVGEMQFCSLPHPLQTSHCPLQSRYLHEVDDALGGRDGVPLHLLARHSVTLE